MCIRDRAVSKWESSQAVPELEKLKELCRIFGVSLNELLQLEENGQVREEENLLSQQAEKNIAEPVSYTHLDVYKRQVLFRIGQISRSYIAACGIVVLFMVITMGCLHVWERKKKIIVLFVWG